MGAEKEYNSNIIVLEDMHEGVITSVKQWKEIQGVPYNIGFTSGIDFESLLVNFSYESANQSYSR